MMLMAPEGPLWRRRAAGQAAQERYATDLADLPRMDHQVPSPSDGQTWCIMRAMQGSVRRPLVGCDTKKGYQLRCWISMANSV
jgi:hypothetical protein